MNWTPLIGPAVVAAVISALVAWITTSRRFAVDRELTERKIKADIDIAERRFQFDKELAEHRVRLDVALAEKKFAFDQSLIAWRRRYELAEQVLIASYEARDVLIWVRAPVGFFGEGETREVTEPESKDLRERRNSYFITLERLTRETKIFSTLHALRYAAAAHLGEEAAKPIAAITESYQSIRTATGILIQMSNDLDKDVNDQGLQPLLQAIGRGRGPRPDADDKKIDGAIGQLQAICDPILSVKMPT